MTIPKHAPIGRVYINAVRDMVRKVEMDEQND